MRRKRPGEERESTTTDEGRPAPVTGILALQQSAGNHAVAGMLARKEDVPQAEPPTVDISDLGVVIVENWSPADQANAGGGGSRHQPDADDGHLTIAVSAKMGSHSPKLQQWMAGGKTIDLAAFENKGIKLRLENAHITSYSATEREGVPTEAWSIDGKQK